MASSPLQDKYQPPQYAIYVVHKYLLSTVSVTGTVTGSGDIFSTIHTKLLVFSNIQPFLSPLSFPVLHIGTSNHFSPVFLKIPTPPLELSSVTPPVGFLPNSLWLSSSFLPLTPQSRVLLSLLQPLLHLLGVVGIS